MLRSRDETQGGDTRREISEPRTGPVRSGSNGPGQRLRIDVSLVLQCHSCSEQ
jgi:hypothetical protein